MKYLKLVKAKAEKKSTKDFSLLNSNAVISCKEYALSLEKKINSLKASIAKGKESEYFNAQDVVEDIMSLKVSEAKLAELVNLQKELF